MPIMASASLAIINEVITLSDDDDEIIELAQVRMPWNIHAQSTSPSRETPGTAQTPISICDVDKNRHHVNQFGALFGHHLKPRTISPPFIPIPKSVAGVSHNKECLLPSGIDFYRVPPPPKISDHSQSKQQPNIEQFNKNSTELMGAAHPLSLHCFVTYQMTEGVEIRPALIVEAIMNAPFINDWREKRAARKIFSLIDKRKYQVDLVVWQKLILIFTRLKSVNDVFKLMKKAKLQYSEYFPPVETVDALVSFAAIQQNPN